MNKACVLCGQPGDELYGYVICSNCKEDMRLYTDKTIGKHVVEYQANGGQSYAKDVAHHLDILDKDYVKKKIKLLHIQDRLRHMLGQESDK